MSQIITFEGFNYLLNTGVKGSAQVTQWYLMLFEGNYTPTPLDVMATLPPLAIECTAYDGVQRLPFTAGTVSNAVLDNAAAVAEYTMTANKTIYGAGIVSSPTKGSTAGILLAVGRFSSPKVREAGEILRLTAGLQLFA